MTDFSLRSSTRQFGKMLLACRRSVDDTLIVGRGGGEPALAALQSMDCDFTVIEDSEMGAASFVWTTAAALGELAVSDEALDAAEADGD